MSMTNLPFAFLTSSDLFFFGDDFRESFCWCSVMYFEVYALGTYGLWRRKRMNQKEQREMKILPNMFDRGFTRKDLVKTICQESEEVYCFFNNR